MQRCPPTCNGGIRANGWQPTTTTDGIAATTPPGAMRSFGGIHWRTGALWDIVSPSLDTIRGGRNEFRLTGRIVSSWIGHSGHDGGRQHAQGVGPTVRRGSMKCWVALILSDSGDCISDSNGSPDSAYTFHTDPHMTLVTVPERVPYSGETASEFDGPPADGTPSGQPLYRSSLNHHWWYAVGRIRP